MKKLRTYLLGLRPFAFIILLLLINFSCKKEKIPTDICNNFTPYNGEDSLGYLIDEKVNQIEIATLKTAELLEHRKNTLPKSFDHGNMITSSSSAWTSGFFGGILWQLYENNPCPSFYKFAELYTRRVEREKSTKTHHDVGYIIYSSFGTALRIDNANNRKDIVLQAANSLLSRFSETVGLIRSWDWNQENWNYPVIIDNMMNLELLLWAYKQTNSAKYYDAAISHANKTMTHHYREDYSSYHLVDYNIENGTVRSKQTVQGFSKNSSWARGQAWGLYGFTMMYRETGLKKYLQHAEKIADFILKHPRLPSDKIPYWDFDDPRIPNTKRDASAAAIMASAFVELSQYSTANSDSYRQIARNIIYKLSSDEYFSANESNGNFILQHSVGSLPSNSAIDNPQVFTDYYYIEALMRYKKYFL